MKIYGKKEKGGTRDFENFSCKFSQIIKLRVKRHQFPLSILFPVLRIPIFWTAFAIFPSAFWQMPVPSSFIKERDSHYDKIIPSYVTCITILLRGCLQNWRLALIILFLQNFHISVARNWRRKKRQFNFPWKTTMQFFRKYWSLPSTFCITVSKNYNYVLTISINSLFLITYDSLPSGKVNLGSGKTRKSRYFRTLRTLSKLKPSDIFVPVRLTAIPLIFGARHIMSEGPVTLQSYKNPLRYISVSVLLTSTFPYGSLQNFAS